MAELRSCPWPVFAIGFWGYLHPCLFFNRAGVLLSVRQLEFFSSPARPSVIQTYKPRVPCKEAMWKRTKHQLWLLWMLDRCSWGGLLAWFVHRTMASETTGRRRRLGTNRSMFCLVVRIARALNSMSRTHMYCWVQLVHRSEKEVRARKSRDLTEEERTGRIQSNLSRTVFKTYGWHSG